MRKPCRTPVAILPSNRRLTALDSAQITWERSPLSVAVLGASGVADLAAAFQTVLERGKPRTPLIAGDDDEPMRYGELFEIVASLCGQKRGAPGIGAESVVPGFRVANAAPRELAWAPRYASVRSGLVATAELHSAR